MASRIKWALCGQAAVLWLLGSCIIGVTPIIRFTNVRCSSYNASRAVVQYCHIKAVGRNVNEMSFRINLFNKPLRNFQVGMHFMKKTNGYQPFKQNITLNACSFLEKRNNPILNSLYEPFLKHSNLNHTCPFDHDLIVDKVRFEDSSFRWIPFPYGDYGFYTKWWEHGQPFVQVDFFVSFVQNKI